MTILEQVALVLIAVTNFVQGVEISRLKRRIRDGATSTEVTSASTFEVGETDD